jgi:hypothetical protein
MTSHNFFSEALNTWSLVCPFGKVLYFLCSTFIQRKRIRHAPMSLGSIPKRLENNKCFKVDLYKNEYIYVHSYKERSYFVLSRTLNIAVRKFKEIVTSTNVQWKIDLKTSSVKLH